MVDSNDHRLPLPSFSFYKTSGERAPGLGAMLRQRLFLFQPVKLPTPGPGQMPGLEDNAASPLKQAPAFESAGLPDSAN